MASFYRRFLTDVGWNSVSAFLQAIAVQILVLPLLGRSLQVEAFSELLLVIAIVNITGLVAGTALSNFVLREHGRRVDGNTAFADLETVNASFVIVATLASMLVGVATLVLTSHGPVLSMLYALLIATRVYLVSEHRIALRYARIAASNLVMAVLMCIALWVFHLVGHPHPIIILVLGELGGLLTLAYRSRFVSCPAVFDYRLARPLRECGALGLSSVAQNTLAYSDRLVIGRAGVPAMVPVFFAASVVGRLGQMVLNIAATVVLSYLVRAKKNDLAMFIPRLVLGSMLVGVGSWIVLMLLSESIISMLYPAFYQEAREIILSVNIGFSAKISSIAMRPLAIRVLKVSALVKLDVGAAVTYVLGGGIAVAIGGLKAFAIAFAVIMVVRTFIQMLLVMDAQREGAVRSE